VAVIAVVLGVVGCGVRPVAGTPMPAPAPTTTSAPTSTSASASESSSTTTETPTESPSESPTTSSPVESPPATTSPAPGTGPEAVVQAYINAINARDYRRAWELGGKNLGKPYEAFEAGFATTDHDVLRIQSVQGGTVTVELTAVQTDGTQQTYRGTYTVSGGAITKAVLRKV